MDGLNTHRLAILTRARELSASIGRISFRDPRAHNWELYMKQIQMVHTQLITLAQTIYGDSSNSAILNRTLESSLVYVPLVDSFAIEAMLPAKPDADIATRDSEIIAVAERKEVEDEQHRGGLAAATAEAQALVAFDKHCLELMSLSAPIDSPPISGVPAAALRHKLSADSHDPNNTCVDMFFGEHFRTF
eukprot:TRINITY_DN56047_c0_g1_i1.p1 TRINITY_DN56047_c0_g1~~TRINITY_DN56047_c0_g1_i1.p1  ORF type:complete len:190 (-),score=28.90 TRINITY_DN56047_c0_g1_i1:68-637(-)